MRNFGKQMLCFMLILSLILAYVPNASAAASSSKSIKAGALNKKNVTLSVGESTIIKMLNTNKKVTWSIKSGKAYITLKNKKKKQVTVVCKKAGTAKVVGKIGKKKYTVTVKVINKVKEKTDVERFTDFVNEQNKLGAGLPNPGTEEFEQMYSTDEEGRIDHLYLYNLVGDISFADYKNLQAVQVYNINPDDPTGENDLPVTNKITSLDFGKSTMLSEVDLTKVTIPELDLSNLTNLNGFIIRDCTIDTLLPGGKETLLSIAIEGSKIGNAISFKDFVALEDVNISGNVLIKSLDFSGCTALDQAYISDSNLEELNVEGCTSLWRLECYYNNLTTLSVAGLPKLAELHCSNNKLTSINIWEGESKCCPELCILHANENKLVTLDVRGTRVYDPTLNTTERLITYDEGVEIIK